jgi:hypothetical protein
MTPATQLLSAIIDLERLTKSGHSQIKSLVSSVIDEEHPPAPESILDTLVHLDFKPFDKSDWETFNGCDSECPLICYEDKEVWIIDGNRVHHRHTSECRTYQLFTTENE